MGEHITEKAPAKLNLSLDVLGRLEGGYHALRMVMESVSFGDTLEITLRKDGEIRLETGLAWLPRDGRNLAVEAARVFREALGEETLGADILLTKRIPVGAGMGGPPHGGAPGVEPPYRPPLRWGETPGAGPGHRLGRALLRLRRLPPGGGPG